MVLIDLEAAVKKIVRGCDNASPTRQIPFFFIVGAGISHPSILLSSQITERCKRKAGLDAEMNEPTTKRSQLDLYSYWFEKAYPQPRQRQRYLRRLVERRPISAANFRLAQLLVVKKIANVVVTPNFDDLLSQALTLLGSRHIVCDHPATAQRINPESKDIQILHVHGTYLFYDSCNLKGEIRRRALPSLHTVTTMAACLDKILSQRSPLVIGYSGWKGDVIMQALKRRLQSYETLPYNLYWFVYRQSEIRTLPDFLKSHPQVHIVIPPDPEATRGLDKQPAKLTTRQKYQHNLQATDRRRNSERGHSAQNTLPAQHVLERMFHALEIKPPELISDPLRFFSQPPKSSLIPADVPGHGSDIYLLRDTIVYRPRYLRNIYWRR